MNAAKDTPHLSAELAAFAANLRYEDIPAPVLRRAEDLLLDCLASILAGASARAVQALSLIHISEPTRPY